MKGPIPKGVGLFFLKNLTQKNGFALDLIPKILPKKIPWVGFGQGFWSAAK